MISYIDKDEKENFGYDCLEDIVDWIAKNLGADQVWEAEDLVENVVDTCFEELRILLNGEFTPDQIFDKETLHEWARNNPAET